jgi:hypothetical protein
MKNDKNIDKDSVNKDGRINIKNKCKKPKEIKKDIKKDIKEDSFSFETLEEFLDKFIEYTHTIDNINNGLTKKKIRLPNFPSEISENIVKFCIKKIKKSYPTWDTPNGDLMDGATKIEVKGFSSDGPTSFGPNEKWDILYFVDCKKYKKKQFDVFEIKLSNIDDTFRNIKLTSTTTYGEIADINQRGRLRASFSKFKSELGEHCNRIFNGTLNELK